jgi:hypothetical protein
MLGGLAIKLFNKDQVSAFRIVPHTSEISATGLICTSSRHRHAALPLDKEILAEFHVGVELRGQNRSMPAAEGDVLLI